MTALTTLDIIRKIRAASRAIGVGFEMQTGSTIRHLLVLHTLAADGDMKQVDISVVTGIDRSTMTHVITRLEAAGYVGSSAYPGDNRAKLLHITAKGREHLAKLSKVAEGLFGEQFGLSDQRATVLVNALTKVANYVDSGGTINDAA